MIISSAANPVIKQLIKWQNKPAERRRDNIFIAEGIKMYTEAPKEKVRAVYISEGFAKNCDKSIRDSADIVTDNLFSKISDTKTPQGILTVLERPEYDEGVLANDKGLYIALENIQDPGNLGAIMRTAEGAGVSAVIMSKDTADIFNPKVVRATMGAVYRVPFVYKEDFKKSLEELKIRKIRLYAAHLKGEKYYYETDYTGGAAIIIGNESRGILESTASLADELVKIPMEGLLESLNASVAAGILMYEAYKQRKLRMV